ncbi:MAG: response regulator, partial [Pseudomonadales bacterium]
MRILLVEDEQQLREQLTQALTDAGYAVDAAADGEDAIFMGREYPYDLAVIDLGLPKVDGIEVIKTLRKLERDFPVLILTARGHWQDKVNGLESGADDYLVKPFHVPELLARLNALLRRRGGAATPVLVRGPIEVDTLAKTVKVNDAPVTLTAYEYKVLEYLLVN